MVNEVICSLMRCVRHFVDVVHCPYGSIVDIYLNTGRDQWTMFQDQRYSQSLHECYRDVYTESKQKTALERLQNLNEQFSDTPRVLSNEEYEYLLDCLIYEGYAEDYESAVNIAESMSDGWIESYFSEDAYDSVVADLNKQYGDSAIITKPNPRKNKAARRVANVMNKRSDNSPLYADGTTKASQARYKPNKPGQFTYHGN